MQHRSNYHSQMRDLLFIQIENYFNFQILEKKIEFYKFNEFNLFLIIQLLEILNLIKLKLNFF